MADDIRPRGQSDEIFGLLNWNDHGLVVTVAQDAKTNEVLMVAWADREALARTLETGRATYRSRRRGLWVKGETSGYTQKVMEVRTDCDGDCLLYLVEAPGPACHLLKRSCFSYRISVDGSVHCDRPTIG